MTDTPPGRTDKPLPHFTDRAQADLDARRLREAAALRANLHRRKAQMRERAVPPPASPGSAQQDVQEGSSAPPKP